MSSISVVIYGLNEETNFNNVVLEAHEYLQKITDDSELILINDGSTDSTAGILAQLQTRLPKVKVITHTTPLGIGACLREGYLAATSELITFLPADGQIDPEDLSRFANAIKDVDFVTSYFKSTPFPFLRKVLSKSVRLIVFILFGPFPRVEGSYMFRRKILEKITLRSNSFSINFEFVIKAKRAGFKFKEIPTLSRKRLFGQSKISNFRTIKIVFQELLKIKFDL